MFKALQLENRNPQSNSKLSPIYILQTILKNRFAQALMAMEPD